MNRENFSKNVGILMIVLCFVASGITVLFRSSDHLDPHLIVIRLAHYQLESGVRKAIDAEGRAYEKICAERGQQVKVEQLAIPESVYPNWFVTQLVGGTAPDLVELGKNDSDDRKARYFVPLTSALEIPNVYDKGTELEKMRWRDTFIGGLASVYNPTLLDYYQVSTTIVTIRMFYNVDLYKKIAGDVPPPKTYAEFRDLCVKIQEYGKKQGTSLLPIAGSRYNSPFVTSQLMGSQTQRLGETINRRKDLRLDQEQVALAYIRGDWNLHSPPILSGLNIVRDVSQFMQPGYLQLAREDATFYFVQGSALMLSTGSWDASSILSQAPFPVGVFQIPLPSREDPQYGAFVRGQLSEAGSGVGFDLGLYRYSAHSEVALDFLRFLSSKQGAKLFTDSSGWYPVIRGVEPDARVKQFQPILDGYIQGFNLDLGGGGDSERVYENNFYRLFNEPNGLADFTKAASGDYSDAARSDESLLDKNRVSSLSRSDTTLAAVWWRGLQHPQDAELQRKLHELTELQTNQELASAMCTHTLSAAKGP